MLRYGRIDTDYGMLLRTPVADGPIYMLNLTRYQPDAHHVRVGGLPVDSVEPAGRYAPLDVLAAIGAKLCFVADVVASPGNWHRVAAGPVSEFAVEGTLMGDGRQWTGVRYTTIEPGTALPLGLPPPGYEALLLEPTIERWG